MAALGALQIVKELLSLSSLWAHDGVDIRDERRGGERRLTLNDGVFLPAGCTYKSDRKRCDISTEIVAV